MKTINKKSECVYSCAAASRNISVITVFITICHVLRIFKRYLIPDTVSFCVTVPIHVPYNQGLGQYAAIGLAFTILKLKINLKRPNQRY